MNWFGIWNNMIIDNAEETILIQESMSERLSVLEAQRLMAHRRHFLIKPAIDLLKQRRNNRRTKKLNPANTSMLVSDE